MTDIKLSETVNNKSDKIDSVLSSLEKSHQKLKKQEEKIIAALSALLNTTPANLAALSEQNALLRDVQDELRSNEQHSRLLISIKETSSQVVKTNDSKAGLLEQLESANIETNEALYIADRLNDEYPQLLNLMSSYKYSQALEVIKDLIIINEPRPENYGLVVQLNALRGHLERMIGYSAPVTSYRIDLATTAALSVPSQRYAYLVSEAEFLKLFSDIPADSPEAEASYKVANCSKTVPSTSISVTATEAAKMLTAANSYAVAAFTKSLSALTEINRFVLPLDTLRSTVSCITTKPDINSLFTTSSVPRPYADRKALLTKFNIVETTVKEVLKNREQPNV